MSRINYIFSVNAGRSGSHYLHVLLQHAEGCCSFHEAPPRCNGSEMRDFLSGRPERMIKLVHAKVDQINARRKDPYHIYAETSHHFIKGFGWILPRYLPEEQIGVIVLRRDHDKTAASLMRIGCSPLTDHGRNWIMTPEIAHPLVKPPSQLGSPRTTYAAFRTIDCYLRIANRVLRRVVSRAVPRPQFIVDYEWDCVRWYIDETYRRAESYRKKFPRMRYLDITLEELNEYNTVLKMLDHFGLAAKPSLAEVVGKPTNLKEDAPCKSVATSGEASGYGICCRTSQNETANRVAIRTERANE
jgi:hypothetical protein